MADSQTNNKTALIKAALNERVKVHNVYDGQGRITDTYVAARDQVDGGPCLRTRYAFINPTSSSIVYMQEDEATWNASWEVI